MAFALNIGKCSLLGNYRENNEDAVDVKAFPDLTVAIVADGMGGQAAGEIASKKAIEIIPRELRKSLTPALSAEGVKNAIRRAIVQANEEIMAMAALDRELKNMGTTIVVTLWRKGNEMYLANLGDSRAQWVRRCLPVLTPSSNLTGSRCARLPGAPDNRGRVFPGCSGAAWGRRRAPRAAV